MFTALLRYARALLLHPFGGAIVIGLVIYCLIGSLEGPVTCRDGWQSPSIGIRGACSWHGGVDHTGALMALLGGLIGGIIFGNYRARRLEAADAKRWLAFQKTQGDIKARAAEQGISCPICSYPLKRVLVRKGKRKGTYFMGCSKYPLCTGSRDDLPSKGELQQPEKMD